MDELKALAKRKLIVCGGRDFDDENFVFEVLDKINPTVIVNGGARGADNLSTKWAQSRGKEFREYPAKWSIHGKIAGPLRNKEMFNAESDEKLNEENGEVLLGVLCFPGGRGTEHMMQISIEKLGKEKVLVIKRGE